MTSSTIVADPITAPSDNELGFGHDPATMDVTGGQLRPHPYIHTTYTSNFAVGSFGSWVPAGSGGNELTAAEGGSQQLVPPTVHTAFTNADPVHSMFMRVECDARISVSRVIESHDTAAASPLFQFGSSLVQLEIQWRVNGGAWSGWLTNDPLCVANAQTRVTTVSAIYSSRHLPYHITTANHNAFDFQTRVMYYRLTGSPPVLVGISDGNFTIHATPIDEWSAG